MSHSNDNHNKGGLVAFIFSMVFTCVFFIWISFFHPGVNLQEVPEVSAEQGQVLAGSGEVKKAFDAAGVAEPWQITEEMIAHGAGVYKTNCAICHGAEGKGDGPAGKALVPPPRNLITGGWVKGGTSVALYETLLKGIPGTSMAAFAHIPKNDRWAIVHFIRSITKDKPKDDLEKLKAYSATAK